MLNRRTVLIFSWYFKLCCNYYLCSEILNLSWRISNNIFFLAITFQKEFVFPIFPRSSILPAACGLCSGLLCAPRIKSNGHSEVFQGLYKPDSASCLTLCSSSVLPPTGFSPHTAFPIATLFSACDTLPARGNPLQPSVPPEWLACCGVMPWVPFTTLISMSCIVTLIHHSPSLLNASWVGTVSVLLISLPVTPNRVPSTLYRTQAFVQRMATDWLEIYSSGWNLIVLGQWHHFLDRNSCGRSHIWVQPR